MREYLDIVKNVLDNGVRKENRTGVDTLVVPNQHFSHDMREGFPLLTTKKVYFKGITIELEGFIKGITDKQWYKDRQCKIWNEWGNPRMVEHRIKMEGPIGEDSEWRQPVETEEARRKRIQEEVQDLGPIYGYQWRRFDRPYHGEDAWKEQPYEPLPHMPEDQLARIIETLKTNPNDRRLVCSAWNPHQLCKMALPPCHLLFVLTHIDGVLSLHWTQRSCDLMLGVPFNIAGYGLLLELIAKDCGMTAGNLSGMLCDCHIYENQLEAAAQQIQREPLPLPKLRIAEPFTSIFDWTYQDVELLDYKHLGKIDFGEVAV
jgi:thymidylate synthase